MLLLLCLDCKDCNHLCMSLDFFYIKKSLKLRSLTLFFPSASMFLSTFSNIWKEIATNICYSSGMENIFLRMLLSRQLTGRSQQIMRDAIMSDMSLFFDHSLAGM